MRFCIYVPNQYVIWRGPGRCHNYCPTTPGFYISIELGSETCIWLQMIRNLYSINSIALHCISYRAFRMTCLFVVNFEKYISRIDCVFITYIFQPKKHAWAYQNNIQIVKKRETLHVYCFYNKHELHSTKINICMA